VLKNKKPQKTNNGFSQAVVFYPLTVHLNLLQN